MASLSPLDWVVLAAFLGLTLALGLSAKLRESTSLQFLAAGRSLTLPFFVASLVSTWYGGILGIGESVTYFGLGTWLLMGAPYYVFALIYAFFYAHRVREADQLSIPERLAASAGKGPALVGAVLVFLLGVPAAHVLMLGVLAQALTGWDLWICVILATVFGSLFLLKSGLLADVRVSILSFVLMYVGFAMLVGWCLATHPLPAAWKGLENPALYKADGGVGPIAVISFFLLGAWTLIDPGFHQRTAAAGSPALARKGILVSIVCWIVFDLLSISAGMYALTLLPEQPKNPLLIFPLLGSHVLPAGMKGLFFAGLLGTILTAMVGYALVSGAAFGRDLMCRIQPKWNEVTLSRAGIVVALAVSILLALSIESVVALWYSWGGCIIGALLIPVSHCYGLLGRRRMHPGVMAWSMGLAFGASLALMVWGIASGNPSLNLTLPQAVFGYTLPNTLAGATFGLGTMAPSLAVSALVAVCFAWVKQDDSRREPGSPAI